MVARMVVVRERVLGARKLSGPRNLSEASALGHLRRPQMARALPNREQPCLLLRYPISFYERLTSIHGYVAHSDAAKQTSYEARIVAPVTFLYSSG